MQKELHPSVIKFKEFVKKNPNLIREVRKGNTTWQELYEDWYLLGEDDQRWGTTNSDAKTTEKKDDWISTVLGTVQKMDPNQIQVYVNNLSQALGAIQGVISQLKGNGSTTQVKPQNEPRHPFMFRKD